MKTSKLSQSGKNRLWIPFILIACLFSHFPARAQEEDGLWMRGAETLRFQTTRVSGDRNGFSRNYGQYRIGNLTEGGLNLQVEGNISSHLGIKASFDDIDTIRDVNQDLRESLSLRFFSDNYEIILGRNFGTFEGTEFTMSQKPFTGLWAWTGWGRWKARVVAARSEGQSRHDEIMGKDVQGPYLLERSPVVAGSERVYLKDLPGGVWRPQRRGFDYEIDYIAGSLTFLRGEVDSETLVGVDYETVFPAGGFNRNLGGIRLEYALKESRDDNAQNRSLIGITFLDERDKNGEKIPSVTEIQPLSHQIAGIDLALDLTPKIRIEGEAGRSSLERTGVGSAVVLAMDETDPEGIWDMEAGGSSLLGISAESDPAHVRDENYSLKMEYILDPASGGDPGRVGIVRTLDRADLSIYDTASIPVFGDAGGETLRIILFTDDDNYAFHDETVTWTGWRAISFPLSGMAASGIPRMNAIRKVGIRLLNPGAQSLSGTLWIDAFQVLGGSGGTDFAQRYGITYKDEKLSASYRKRKVGDGFQAVGNPGLESETAREEMELSWTPGQKFSINYFDRDLRDRNGGDALTGDRERGVGLRIKPFRNTSIGLNLNTIANSSDDGSLNDRTDQVGIELEQEFGAWKVGIKHREQDRKDKLTGLEFNEETSGISIRSSAWKGVDLGFGWEREQKDNGAGGRDDSEIRSAEVSWNRSRKLKGRGEYREVDLERNGADFTNRMGNASIEFRPVSSVSMSWRLFAGNEIILNGDETTPTNYRTTSFRIVYEPDPKLRAEYESRQRNRQNAVQGGTTFSSDSSGTIRLQWSPLEGMTLNLDWTSARQRTMVLIEQARSLDMSLRHEFKTGWNIGWSLTQTKRNRTRFQDSGAVTSSPDDSLESRQRWELGKKIGSRWEWTGGFGTERVGNRSTGERFSIRRLQSLSVAFMPDRMNRFVLEFSRDTSHDPWALNRINSIALQSDYKINDDTSLVGRIERASGIGYTAGIGKLDFEWRF